MSELDNVLQPPERRYAILQVSPEFFIESCKTRGGLLQTYRVCGNGLPEDARFCGSTWSVGIDGARGVIMIQIESATFAHVPVGELLPILPAPEFQKISEVPAEDLFVGVCPRCGGRTSELPETGKTACGSCSWVKGK